MPETGGGTVPRPCKRRRICSLPIHGGLAPLEGAAQAPPLRMALEEYEAIRLIDLAGLSQEECAARMGVARTTAQAIYASARRKLAACLVEGLELRVEGGNYELCQGGDQGCGRCELGLPEDLLMRCASERKGENEMRIAVTYENGQVFQHFGHSEQFKIYDVEGTNVVRSEVVGTNGSGHGALAGMLRLLKVDALICGGIGGGAQQALAECGIQLYAGVSGDADAAVQSLLEGKLNFSAEANCDHHGQHGHEHGDCSHHGHGDCGEHGGCGRHGHGGCKHE